MQKNMYTLDAHIQQVADKIHNLESAKELWPQPVPDSTSKECYAYRNSIQFKPLSICASCGADDRQRTGSYIPVSTLTPIDNLVVNNTHVLKHAKRSRFKCKYTSLRGVQSWMDCV